MGNRLMTVCFGLFCAVQLSAQTPVVGRFVRVEIPKAKATLSLAEVEVFSKGENVALKGRAQQSQDAHGAGAARAIDGNTDTTWGGGSITHTPEDQPNPWWEVDLRAEFPLERIVLWNRSEIPDRLNDCSVMIVGADRRVKWERTVPKPEPKATTLTVDTGEKSPALGKTIPRKIEPATDGEIAAAYEKRATWIETVLATQAKLEAFRNLKPITQRLLQDFPEARQEIADEFAGFAPLYHDRRYGSLDELARQYVNHTPDPKRRAESEKLLPRVKDAADLAEIRHNFRAARIDDLMLTAGKLFNPEALERAINAFAARYPDVYADKDALLKRVAEVRQALAAAGNDFGTRLAAARQAEALNEAVYLKHPAVDFKELLFVRRASASIHSGLPQNWQGNSSVPLHGYVNDVVRAPLKQGAGEPQVVYASECFVGDVDLDYDARRIMYSCGRPGERGWRVFETEIDKPGTAREVTPGDQPDIDYYDPCYLPDGRRLFVATSGYQGVPCVSGSDYVGNLHSMDPDGTIRRLVFDQDNSWCPTALVNGRILYLRWEYTDSAHYFSRVLMSMNPDGTDQKAFYGSNSYWPNSLFYARPLPGSATKFVGIVSGHHGHARKGELVLFDASRGRHETSGAAQKIPGYGKPVENITKDMLVNGSKPLFLHPFPLCDDLFLVSMEGDNGLFSIVLADIYDNLIPLWQSPFAHLYEPVPLKPQPRPPLPADRITKGSKECTVYVVGAHLGEGLRGVPAGKTKAVRIFQYEYSPRNVGGHYVIGFEGPWDPRVILGTVEVEEDGSCLFTAPANVPLALQPLDEDGQAMQIMRSWFVGMPGERVSCAGCHEEQNNSPSSRPMQAVLKKPQAIKPWYGPRRNFAFDREVQNVLDASCVGCHNGQATAKNKLGQPIPNFENTRGDGGFSTAYMSLHPYVRRNGPEGDYHLLTTLEFHADTSELVQILKKGHQGVRLSAEQWDRLITWIDLNVPYWGSWTERTGGGKQEVLSRRREMAIRYANDDFDPERIPNPYKPMAFAAPQRPADPAPAPAVEGWPFDAAAAKARQGGSAMAEYDLGDGQKLKVVRIPAGRFAMGSNDETPAEQPVCAVTIDKPFWMGATEVTMGQFRQFDPSFENGVYDMHYKDQVNRGYFVNDPEFPAIRVSWEQANAYCAWLSKRIGKTVRLPTEAQWEWACRAGSATPLNYGGLDDDFSARENLADYMLIELAVEGVDPKPIARGDDPNPARRPSPLYDYELRDRRFNDGVLHLAKVGRYAPNAWGLHDMHGNVAEWTCSAYKPYPYSETDGRNNANPDERKAVRGGSWTRRQHRATSSWRWGYPGWM
ncbi:MAG TPA: SUMF1/EgtB/PvdO family nonheme iron enzyme, partial [Phycisphaerae bacterium]|nr:SUMF1/EgtB/PvdO family nonheme iron enzyme [Phycisphaerae bacterium]HRT42947.1 SUMF1/EgtB/PvdO family nonheme iron enzyme [Phycisphaerae bacterium]